MRTWKGKEQDADADFDVERLVSILSSSFSSDRCGSCSRQLAGREGRRERRAAFPREVHHCCVPAAAQPPQLFTTALPSIAAGGAGGQGQQGALLGQVES